MLAPGSNVYHYDHIHVDLMRRATRRLICQPAAVSGEEVAARVMQRNPYASHEQSVTGSLGVHKTASAHKHGERVNEEDGSRTSRPITKGGAVCHRNSRPFESRSCIVFRYSGGCDVPEHQETSFGGVHHIKMEPLVMIRTLSAVALVTAALASPVFAQEEPLRKSRPTHCGTIAAAITRCRSPLSSPRARRSPARISTAASTARGSAITIRISIPRADRSNASR